MACLPGLAELCEPGGDVAGHDDQRVLQLPVGLSGQLTVDELGGGDDLLTRSVLQHNTVVRILSKHMSFLQTQHFTVKASH